jgi:hypothetical protein
VGRISRAKQEREKEKGERKERESRPVSHKKSKDGIIDVSR